MVLRTHATIVCITRWDCLLQEGTTPLILAAANNHLECVKELLDQGADAAARRLVSEAPPCLILGEAPPCLILGEVLHV